MVGHNESGYPASPSARTRWITAKRGPKNRLDPVIPYAYLWEEEIGTDGELLPTATVLLTNRECPFRCLMCDLWQNTLDASVPVGAIAAQIRHALDRLPSVRQVKLYNAGSFFDPRAVPAEDDVAIARMLAGVERVIVECHPAFVGERCFRFGKRIQSAGGRLEVAIGLETVHPLVLDALNKRFTVADFARSADLLRAHAIDLRVFLLARPPFLTEAEGLAWARRSLDAAFGAGATACTLIPTRGGNGAMEALAASGQFAPPSLRSLEAAQEYGLSLGQGRVFADTWDVERFYACACSPLRAGRLEHMNRTQAAPPPICCDLCSSV